jgi:cysteine sulfinate desulfinase/cysteine desulfurase-like protein
MIYADHAATTKLCQEARDAMKPYLNDEYGNASQPYSFSRKAKKALKKSREIIASLIGASPDEIYFTSGGTESDNWVIKSTLFNKGKKGVLTSEIEHHAILNSCTSVAALGIPVDYVSVDKSGVVTSNSLSKAMDLDTGLVSIMYANNEIGTIEPIQELAAIAHRNDSLFHTDAVQAVGHIPINVREAGIDMLSSSAHKFNGPKGIGFLYLRKGLKIHSFMDGGSQEAGNRAGTENVASIVGMAAALKANVSQMEKHTQHLRNLEQVFLNELDSTGLVFIRNGSQNHLPGNVNISIKGAEGEMLLHRLDLMGIYISTGSACDSVNTQISHVIKAINVPEDYAEGTIRITFGPENTKAEAIEIARSLQKILR